MTRPIIYLVEYAAARTIHGVQLVDRATGQFKATPTLAAGDFKIEKDGGTASNLATLPTVVPSGGSSLDIDLSAAETQCAQAVIRGVDAAGLLCACRPAREDREGGEGGENGCANVESHRGPVSG